MADKPRLGFIGLGVMGGRMCRNLARKSGCAVTGFDVDAGRMEALAADGVAAAASLADLADRTDIIFMCVPGEPQVRDVCFGEAGLVEATRAGQTVVDMTTATVEVNREVAAALQAKGVSFLDAPVVGAAERGPINLKVR